MPGQFLPSHFYLFTIFGKSSKLVLEIERIERLPEVTVCKYRIAAVGFEDGFQQQPALYESIRIRCHPRLFSLHEVGCDGSQRITYCGIIDRAARELKPHQLATYARELAESFNLFYRYSPVLDAEPGLRQARMGLARAAKNALRVTLDTLGIAALETM